MKKLKEREEREERENEKRNESWSMKNVIKILVELILNLN